MYKNILVPVEPSHAEKHEHALKMAEQLADREGAKITLVTVIEPVPGYFGMSDALPDIQRQAADRTLKDLKAFAGDRPGLHLKVLHGHAATEIIGFAERIGADCVIVASHRPGLADYLIGSTAARVVRHSPCSVHVMR